MVRQYDETGFSAPKPGDTLCQGLVRQLRCVVECSTGQSYKDFQCIQYSEQPIYGTNFKAKVTTGDGQYVHLHFYKPLRESPPQLNFIELGKRLNDPLNDIYSTRYYNTPTN